MASRKQRWQRPSRIFNRGLVLAKLRLQLSNTGPLRLPWKDCMVGPGQHVTVTRMRLELSYFWGGLRVCFGSEARDPKP